MSEQRLGIIMHGVTGRMGLNQHLKRSIMELIADGGVELANGDRVVPDPILVGRNLEKVRKIADEHGIKRYTDDLDKALENTEDALFFDAGTTDLRHDLLTRAISKGKHVYCEKPMSANLAEARQLCRLAKDKGVKTGVVQDKLYLPGILKLRRLIGEDFFGRILSVKLDFGYWVFTGEDQPAQRPSWNYQKAKGGGIMLDMLAHWRYVLDNLFGPVQSISSIAANHINQRWDEEGNTYKADADDAVYAHLELEGGIIAQVSSSWCTRVNRDDLLTIHVDGTDGSAVAGLNMCKVQHLDNTPRPVWNPDEAGAANYFEQWVAVDDINCENAFKHQWVAFIKHLYEDGPWKHTLEEGAKGVQLAEAALESWKERRWIEIKPIEF